MGEGLYMTLMSCPIPSSWLKNKFKTKVLGAVKSEQRDYRVIGNSSFVTESLVLKVNNRMETAQDQDHRTTNTKNTEKRGADGIFYTLSETKVKRQRICSIIKSSLHLLSLMSLKSSYV